jgi:excisionase family DNA binding protein
VPETEVFGDPWGLTFGRPPHRQLWRGCAARMAGGEALPRSGCRGTQRNFPGRLRRKWHFSGMDRKAALPNFFTERSLADYLAVSDRTVRNWIRRGELPSYKLGAARRIDPADVEDFLARHKDEAA